MTQSEMKHRIAEEGWCVIDAVIPPEAVAQVRDSILATVAAHKLPDPRNQLDKVSGLVNFDRIPTSASGSLRAASQRILCPWYRSGYLQICQTRSNPCSGTGLKLVGPGYSH